MSEKFYQALDTLIKVAKAKDVDLLKGTVKGHVFQGVFDFRLFLFMLSRGVGVETSRKQIIDNCYMSKNENFRIQERTVDSYVSRVNSVLKSINYPLRIANDGNPRHMKGFYLKEISDDKIV